MPFRSALAILALLFLLAGCRSHRGPSREEIELAARMNDLATAENRKAHLAFDPAKDTLVADLAQMLVRTYRLPLGYTERPDEPDRRRIAAYRIVRYPRCTGPTEGLGDAYSLSAVYNDRSLCTLTTYEPAPASAVIARTTQQRIVVDGVATNQFRTTVTRPDGRSTSVIYYAARDEAARDRLGAAALAGALGLTARSPGDPEPPGQDVADRLISESRLRMGAATRDLIDALALRGTLASGSSYSAQQVDPQSIARNADGLIRQLGRGLRDDQSGVAVSDISKTLARLPDEDWNSKAPTILAVLESGPPPDAVVHETLLVRLADQGPVAVPLLARARGGQLLPDAVLVGACKIGSPARKALESRFIEAWRLANQPDLKKRPSKSGFGPFSYRQCVKEGERSGPPDDITLSPCWKTATLSERELRIYLTMRRMGLGAQADAMAKHDRKRKYAAEFAAIGPQSPASTCLPAPSR